MVFKRYDSILKSVKVIENAYGVKRIPLTTLDEIIKKARFDGPQDPNLLKFTRQFNKTLDSLQMFSKDNAKIIGDKCISRNELKQWIDALKAAFIEGQNQKPQPNDQDYS